jgi:hypothetical protein
MSSLTNSRHRLETCEDLASVCGSSMNVRICRQRVNKGHVSCRFHRELTRKQSSSGKVVKGSFFNRGLTNSCTKANCWLLHKFSNSASSRCFSASFISAKRHRTSRTFASSSSPAVLQSGARCIGVGLGAGVGGEAGAEGSKL